MIATMFILAALILSLVAAIGWAAIHGKAVSQAVSSCGECGGETTVTADPANSRLVVKCRDDKCGCTWYRCVRASALSLFGVIQLVLTFLGGALGYALAYIIGYGRGGRAVGTFAGVLIAGLVARFLVRKSVRVLLESNIPPAWQEEIVAYLAPPPFAKKDGGR